MKVANLVVTEIDQLGFLLEQIKNLQEQAESIKDRIKDSRSMDGLKCWEGTVYTARYTEANRKVVDYKSILEALECPEELVTAHTSVSAVYSLKVCMRK